MTVPRKPFTPHQNREVSASGLYALFTYTWPPEVEGRALCADVDPELFFNDGKGYGTTHDAKKVCGLCDVRLTCLEWALTFPYAQDQHGIYGGTTPHERRHLRQQRNRKKAS